MVRWIIAGCLVALLASAACKGESKTEPGSPPAAEPGKAPAPEAKPVEAKPVEAKPAADEPATKAGAPAAKVEEAEGASAGLDVAALSKAYVEIYCAQRKGETEKLLAIYKKYGFTDPRAWTDAWTEAAKDTAWVARVSQEAMKECP